MRPSSWLLWSLSWILFSFLCFGVALRLGLEFPLRPPTETNEVVARFSFAGSTSITAAQTTYSGALLPQGRYSSISFIYSFDSTSIAHGQPTISTFFVCNGVALPPATQTTSGNDGNTILVDLFFFDLNPSPGQYVIRPVPIDGPWIFNNGTCNVVTNYVGGFTGAQNFGITILLRRYNYY